MRKIMVVLLSVVSWGGGGYITSCSLEASVDSPQDKPASLPAGMPPQVRVYGPSIILTGSTTELTYSVKAVGWGATPPAYTAQTSADSIASASAQSIEALIMHYGTLSAYSTNLLADGGGSVTATVKGGTYSLVNPGGSERFVILPLDTGLVKKELAKRHPAGTVNLVLIEKNEDGIALETAGTAGTWGAGTYIKDGIRIMGLNAGAGGSVSVDCKIDDFDDGENNRPHSIGTVLLAGETSEINFYAGDKVNTVIQISEATAGTLSSDAKGIKDLIENNKPTLRVIYRWAD